LFLNTTIAERTAVTFRLGSRSLFLVAFTRVRTFSKFSRPSVSWARISGNKVMLLTVRARRVRDATPWKTEDRWQKLANRFPKWGRSFLSSHPWFSPSQAYPFLAVMLLETFVFFPVDITMTFKFDLGTLRTPSPILCACDYSRSTAASVWVHSAPCKFISFRPFLARLPTKNTDS